MSRKLGRAATAAAAALTAGVALAGCHFAKPPAGSTAGGAASASATSSASAAPAAAGARGRAPAASVVDAPAKRLADAPALLVQCAVDTAKLRPSGQDWFSGGKVHIDTTDATNFNTWWRAHDSPGPYRQTFVIDGHTTHYLAFGATWVDKGGQWTPEHTGRTDPQAYRTSLYAWSVWAAEHDKLPPAVCGARSARSLQAQVFTGSSSGGNPWGS